jgi:hypothetical protein
MSFLNKYYAIWDGEAYLATAFNATSRFDAKEQLLSLIESETDEDDFKSYLSMDVREICNIKGWTLESSNAPFKETYRSAFESTTAKYRVVAAVTTYCYIDVVADSEDEAKEIAGEKDGADFYTMDVDERAGEFKIIEAKIIS